MRGLTSRRRFSVGAAVLTSLLVNVHTAATAVSASAVAAEQKKVLVIYSTRRETQFSMAGDRLIPRSLKEQFSRAPDYYAEYLDGARFPQRGYQLAFRDYLALKYRGVTFDLIIATHALAYEFVAAHRSGLFGSTPVVFLSERDPSRLLPNATGVIERRDFASTLRLALALQPDTTHVFVVLGSSPRDMAMERMARPQFTAFPSLTFTYSSGLDTRTLERRLATLPPHTIVYYLLFYQDGSGVNVNPLQYLDRVAGIANRPIYSWVDSTLGRGVIGGALESIDGQIESVIGIAVRVLRGEPVHDIPPSTASRTRNQVDWRQLRRWDLPEGRVPAGTELLFRPPRVWDRVRPFAIASAAVMLLQAALIVLLLMQQGALKQAQLRIRNLRSRLVSAQDQERARIAGELHDDVSQQLAMLSFDLQVLNGFGPTHDEEVDKVAREALERLERIGRSLRDLSHRLHPSRLRTIGLVRAIGDLERELSRPDVTISFTHANVPDSVPEDVTVGLFRVVQESLRNALAHSGARLIAIHLQGDADRLFLSVRDDGIGFDVAAERGQGLGLISMRDRLDPIGGTVAVRSTPGIGTLVEVCVPAGHTKGGDDAEESLARRRSHDGARGPSGAADIGV